MKAAAVTDPDDVGSMWRERREQQQLKRRANMDASTAKLTELGIEFTSHNGGVHLIVAGRWDFWPSTGKFVERTGPIGKRRTGRGVRNLIRTLDKDANATAV